jgi:hypothetical protein
MVRVTFSAPKSQGFESIRDQPLFGDVGMGEGERKVKADASPAGRDEHGSGYKGAAGTACRAPTGD